MKPSKFISPVTFALPFHQSLHPPKFPSYHTQLSSVGTETSTSPLSPYGFSIFIIMTQCSLFSDQGCQQYCQLSSLFTQLYKGHSIKPAVWIAMNAQI